MIILLHTSKTMRPPPAESAKILRPPVLHSKIKPLAAYLKTIPVSQLSKIMHISPKLADKTHALISSWEDILDHQRPAIDSFLGDIYSGLQVLDWSAQDRDYADKTLRILSGLYGILRPLDGIYPYRLEMGYKLPDPHFSNLYKYWGDTIATTLPANVPIINLAALEYSKVITPYVDAERIVAPSFLTLNSKTGKPNFVVVHAKIARGAFARWLIKNKITDINQLKNFKDLNYSYDEKQSTKDVPVFVCKTFGGIGLSLRLT